MSLATWCSTSIFCRIVAPSFVMVTSPSGLTSILSIPFGPSDVRSTVETERAATMLDCAARESRAREKTQTLSRVESRNARARAPRRARTF